eukprot:Skav216158  [mRNA]  locus=scaffold3788:121016:130780:+ [translate_table: standard]
MFTVLLLLPCVLAMRPAMQETVVDSTTGPCKGRSKVAETKTLRKGGGLEEQICVTDLESCERSIAYEPHTDQYVACKKQFPTPSQPEGQCLMASWFEESPGEWGEVERPFPCSAAEYWSKGSGILAQTMVDKVKDNAERCKNALCEIAIDDLDRKLKEVQSVHNVVEFDADALIARKVTKEKRDPRLHLASGGAQQLAEEVAQETWNSVLWWGQMPRVDPMAWLCLAWMESENAYAQRRRIHEKRFRDAIQGKRQEEQDKQTIREFIGQKLLDHAKETLSGVQ